MQGEGKFSKALHLSFVLLCPAIPELRTGWDAAQDEEAPVYSVLVASAALVSHTDVQQELEWVRKDEGWLKGAWGLYGLLPVLTKVSSPHQPLQATRQLSTPFPQAADGTRGVKPEAAQPPANHTWSRRVSPAERFTRFQSGPFK